LQGQCKCMLQKLFISKSPPKDVQILEQYMPSVYFCHYSCNIFAIRMLYEPIKRHNLVFVKERIKDYNNFMGKYYGDCAYDFTFRAHLHLEKKNLKICIKQVEKHGPLKSFSFFFKIHFLIIVFFSIFKTI
jgi:hypothetical protein